MKKKIYIGKPIVIMSAIAVLCGCANNVESTDNISKYTESINQYRDAGAYDEAISEIEKARAELLSEGKEKEAAVLALKKTIIESSLYETITEESQLVNEADDLVDDTEIIDVEDSEQSKSENDSDDFEMVDISDEELEGVNYQFDVKPIIDASKINDYSIKTVDFEIFKSDYELSEPEEDINGQLLYKGYTDEYDLEVIEEDSNGMTKQIFSFYEKGSKNRIKRLTIMGTEMSESVRFCYVLGKEEPLSMYAKQNEIADGDSFLKHFGLSDEDVEKIKNGDESVKIATEYGVGYFSIEENTSNKYVRLNVSQDIAIQYHDENSGDKYYSLEVTYKRAK